jgi:hypothetical protein
MINIESWNLEHYPYTELFSVRGTLRYSGVDMNPDISKYETNPIQHFFVMILV